MPKNIHDLNEDTVQLTNFIGKRQPERGEI